MFDMHTKEYTTNLASNTPLIKKIDIENGISCFILIDSNSKKIIQPLQNKIVDLILDNVTTKDVYNSFSVSLESINFFINTLLNKENSFDNVNIFVGIMEKNNFYFSKIGQASCYLINNKHDFLEISENSKPTITFDFISSGKLSFGEKIIICNINLFEYFTSGDMEDISFLDTLEKINDNIIKILEDEKIEQNIIVDSFQYKGEIIIERNNETWEKIQTILYKMADNTFTKKIIAFSQFVWEKIEKRGKIFKNIVFFSGIVLSTFLLYTIISSFVGTKVENSKQSIYKEDLIKAREYLNIANENLANPELFDLNIAKVDELIAIVKEQNLFLKDIKQIEDEMSIVKKQFNGVEMYGMDSSNMLFSYNFSDGVKIIELSKKLYVLGKSALYGPLVSGQEIKTHVFDKLDIDDEFLDANVVGENIVIVTKKSRVIHFGKDATFKYINVIGQDTWQGSHFVETYNNNLYMTDKEGKQIYKHSASNGSYTSGVPYLKDSDVKNIGKILSIGIDGGIYILKNDLTLLKFFSAPKYRIQSIVLNKLPKNYTIEKPNVSLFSRMNLNYIYLFLNDKIWIFQPNTKVFSDTKSLTYLGQIEGKNEIILGFYVPRDGEIQILNKKGIYKLNFEIKDDKIILR